MNSVGVVFQVTPLTPFVTESRFFFIFRIHYHFTRC
jgi:hypothetical protein